MRTDRAHVMIAAAMLGKPVEYAASNYHKLPAIAEWSLDAFPVHADRARAGRPTRSRATAPPRDARPGLREPAR